MTRRNLVKLIVVISGALMLASCQPAWVMWVIPGSTADNLVFGWSTTRDGSEKIQPREIRVFPCASIARQSSGSYYPDSSFAVWAASSSDNALPAPTNRLIYGQGFEQSEVRPLSSPGCYTVIAYARRDGITAVATMGFKIDANGAATDMPRDEYENLFR